MNSPFLDRFSISDLEGFSGVKAHTIRVWERRYGLLDPDRTGGNYRQYSLDELKTILNVSFLVDHGLRIGRVAGMGPEEREERVRELSMRSTTHGDTLNSLKLAMLGLDEPLFRSASASFAERDGFNALMERIYVPLLVQVGHLWQSGAICPAQEHFVSNLIRQRILAETEVLPVPAPGDQRYVLFLPEHEIHELGLLYSNYLLRSHGRQTVYLGQGVPAADLRDLISSFNGPITFIGFLTSYPAPDKLTQYFNALRAKDPDPSHLYWFGGARTDMLTDADLPQGFRILRQASDLIDAIAPSPKGAPFPGS